MQCVKDVYVEHVKAQPELKGNLEAGRGIGWRIITDKEPALKRTMVDSALSTFRATGIYLDLLKKGGLPEQFWHLFPYSCKCLKTAFIPISEIPHKC